MYFLWSFIKYVSNSIAMVKNLTPIQTQGVIGAPPSTHYSKVQKYEQSKIGLQHYGKIIKILHGCPFEGWPNRAWSIQQISRFLPKRVGMAQYISPTSVVLTESKRTVHFWAALHSESIFSPHDLNDYKWSQMTSQKFDIQRLIWSPFRTFRVI